MMVGHEGDWDNCNFGEVASQRAEDLLGQTTHPGGDTRAETMGNESKNGMNNKDHAYGSEA
jgi:hypothetical protein